MASALDSYEVDLSSICRACLTEPINTEMYSFSLEDVRIKFSICTSVTVSADEDLPYQICAQCWERCTGWHDYRDMCQENNKRLKEGTVFVKQEAVYSITTQPDEEELEDASGLPIDEEPQLEEVIVEEMVVIEADEEFEEEMEQVDNSNTTEDNSLDCPICMVQSFVDEKCYEEHVRSHYKSTGAKECLVCKKPFTSIYSVIKHTFEHGNQSIPCPNCTKTFKGNGQLRSHINKYHKTVTENKAPLSLPNVPFVEDILNCPMCSVIFSEEEAYDKHIQEHYVGKPSVCLICSKYFKDLVSVYHHMNEHTLRCVPCHLCPKTFKGSAQLKWHITQCHHLCMSSEGDWVEEERSENTADLLKCPICKLDFTEEKKYEQHIKDHYKDGTETNCLICHKEYRNIKSVITHTHEHGSRNIPCNFCGKSFKGNYQLNKHIYKYHRAEASPGLVNEEEVQEDFEEEEAAEGLEEEPSEDILKCPICYKVFEQEKHYQRHIKEHYDDITEIRCLVCLRPFKSMFNVIRHTHEHSTRCLRCEFCDKIFRGTYQLNCHMAKYHSSEYKALKARRKADATHGEEAEPPRHADDVLECPICATEFQSEKLYTDHIKEHFAGVSQSKCPLCDLNFSSIGNLVTHVHDHSRRHIPCELCTKVFKGRDQQQSHLKRFHKMEHEDGEGQSMVLCEFCPAIFKTQRRLLSHKVTHHRQMIDYTLKSERVDSDTMEVLECPICHEELDSEKALDQHIRSHYVDRKDLSCLLCDKVYTSLHCVVMHAHDHSDRTVNCRFCDRLFKGTMRMKAHMNKYHIAEIAGERKGKRPELHACEECGKTFLQRSRLRAHIKTHSTDKPFGCAYCPSFFKSQRNMRMHEVQHTSEKTLQCPQCDLKFYHAKHLKDHIRRHNRTQSFPCDLCPRIFSYRSGLNEHMNSHTRERLYTCEVCGKVFERVSVLNRHRTIHAEVKEGGGRGKSRTEKKLSGKIGGKESKRADALANLKKIDESEEEEQILIEWEEVEAVEGGEGGSNEVVVYQ